MQKIRVSVRLQILCANLHLLEELSKKKELFLQLNNYQKNGMKR